LPNRKSIIDEIESLIKISMKTAIGSIGAVSFVGKVVHRL